VSIHLENLKKNLLKKYETDQLAQVYLAKYPKSTDPIIWAKDFLESITTLQDDPDVLWVFRDEKESVYKVESLGIKALIKFLNFRAFRLKKKFIFINDAHLLSTIVSNKLLKVFEELPENFCLFLFAPQEENLLPTVESRAINILLPQVQHDEIEVRESLQYSSAMDLVNKLKNSDNQMQEEKKFIEESLNVTLQKKQFNDLSAALENLKHYSQSDNFNNSKVSRLSLFFN
jgi:DNA polymerase-3 subunit delta'